MYFSSFGRIPALAFLCLWVGLESTSLVEAQDAAATEAPTSAPTEENWTGCIDPNDPGALVTIGDPTPICLIVSDGTDWSEDRQYFRLLFQPKADEYSRFRVPNSFAELVSDNRPVFASDQIAVHVQSQKTLSFQKLYFQSANIAASNSTSSKVFPYLTAIINVRDGKVEGIAWDDASIFCGGRESTKNTYNFEGETGTASEFGQPVDGCFLSESACSKQAQEGEDSCDLLLYVVWTGTDAKGNPFQSSPNRFSAFPPQNIGDFISRSIPNINIPDIDIPEIPSIGSG